MIKLATSEDDISRYVPSPTERRPQILTIRRGDKTDPKPEDSSGHKSSCEKKDCFQIFGLLHDASVDEIKAAYRNAIKQYHPDYVANLGPELKEVAERKSKELNVAYEEAMSIVEG